MAVPRQKLNEALDIHANLAIRYKQYETADGEIPPLVVLNEMRYALRSAAKLLSQASFDHLSEKEQTGYEESIQEFHHALRNAYHDLVDGIVIQISRIMDGLLSEYPLATANVLREKRLTILADLNEVEKAMAKSRGQAHERKAIYEVDIYDGWFLKIIEHYRFVDQVALPEIIREDNRLTEEKKVSRRRFCLQITLSVLGIVVAITVGIIKILTK